MSARGQGELTPSSVPSVTLLRWLEALRKDVDELQESKARDGLPYPLRWKSTKLTNAPSFHIQLWNPITGELCDVCGGSGTTICDCEDGAPGPPGPPGPPGSAGPGVPTGGASGESLIKVSGADFDTAWGTPDPPDLSIDQLTDVNTSGAGNNDMLLYDSGSSSWFPGGIFLDDLLNVTASSPADGDALVWDNGASAWVPGAGVGSPGPAGPPGGSLSYLFDTGTSVADPGDGHIRFNDAAGLATKLVIDAVDANLVDQDLVIPTWAESNSTVRGTLLVSAAAAPESRWAMFQITGYTFHIGWFEFNVTPVQDVGTAPADEEAVTIVFSRTGDKGTTGSTGATGATGQWGGAVTIPYHFSTTTTNSDPGSGNLRLDQAVQDTASTIRVDVLDVNASSWETLLDTMDLPSHSPKGYIRLVRATAPTEWFLYELMAVDSSSGYRNITVVLSEIGTQAGSSPFVNGELLYLLYDRNGDDGVDGTDFTAAAGPMGYAYRTSNQTITTATETRVDFDTSTAENGMTFNATNDWFVVPSTGWYTLQAVLRWASAAGNANVITRIGVTNAAGSVTTIVASEAIAVGASITVEQSPGITMKLTAGDKVFLQAYHDTGSNRNLDYVSSGFRFISLSVASVEGAQGPQGPAGSGASALDDLTDVDTTGAVSGDHLAFDGSDWVPSTPSVLILDAGSSMPNPGNEGVTMRFKHVVFEDTGDYWWPLGGRMEQIQYEFTHFFNNNAQKLELQSSASGTGAAANAGVAAAGVQGLVSLDTGTTSTGRASYAAGQASALRGTADKIMQFHTRVRFPTLSTSGERYIFAAGYISSLTATSPDGFYFRYDESVSANWYAVVTNNSSGITGVTTGVAVGTNTFQKLRIEVDETATSAKFYIDNVLTNTITTNFPGTTRDFGPGVNMRKTNGTTARTAEVDYLGYWSLMTTTI